MKRLTALILLFLLLSGAFNVVLLEFKQSCVFPVGPFTSSSTFYVVLT